MSGHLAGYNPAQARRFFEEIDTASGYKRAEEKESEYIKAAFFDFQFNRDKPQPLNKRSHDIDTDDFESIATKVLIERTEPRGKIDQNIRLLQKRFVNVQRGLEDEAQNWKERFNATAGRLDLTEGEIVRLRSERDKLTSQLSETEDAAQNWEQRHGALLGRVARTELNLTELRNERDKLTSQLSETEDAAQNWEQRHGALLGRVARTELNLTELRNERDKLTSQLSETERHLKRALRRRTCLFSILILGAVIVTTIVFFAILTPGVVEQDRDLLSYLSLDLPASITLSPESRPRSTPTQTPQPSPTPHMREVIFAGVVMRACPHKDNKECPSLARLTSKDQVTVLNIVQGEQHEGSTLWYRIAWQDGTEEAFVHSSLLGAPTPPQADG